MKKFLSFVFIMFAAAFVANAEVCIQGVPVSGAVAQSVSRQMNGLAVMPVAEGPFSFDQIQNWTGEGANQAAWLFNGMTTERKMQWFGDIVGTVRQPALIWLWLLLRRSLECSF